MLVLTRRAGEALLIGETIELQIVDVDGTQLETRCAVQITDADGNEVALRCVKSRDGTARIIDNG
jgi:Global regulator protein family